MKQKILIVLTIYMAYLELLKADEGTSSLCPDGWVVTYMDMGIFFIIHITYNNYWY